MILFLLIAVISVVLLFVFNPKTLADAISKIYDTQNSSTPTTETIERIDCVGDFEYETECSAACGGGRRSKRFAVTTTAKNGGRQCRYSNGQTIEEDCNTDACPVAKNCQGYWTDWTECNNSCGESGQSTRRYTISVSAENGGAPCAHADGAIETFTCATLPCACGGEWGEWSECDAACGNIEGNVTRTFVANDATVLSEGEECNISESRPCRSAPCPIDCVGSWETDGMCSKDCGGGDQKYLYRISTEASYGGSECPHVEGEERVESCNQDPCPVNCVGEWSEYSACVRDTDGSCEQGSQTRTYNIFTAAAYNGSECEFSNGETQTDCCLLPVDCVGAWSDWTDCSKPCGGGQKYRTFEAVTSAANGGVECDNPKIGDTESVSCNTQTCPTDCQGVWQPITECSEQQACADLWKGNDETGGYKAGTQQAVYRIDVEAANGGAQCPHSDGDTQTQSCNDQPCRLKTPNDESCINFFGKYVFKGNDAPEYVKEQPGWVEDKWVECQLPRLSSCSKTPIECPLADVASSSEVAANERKKCDAKCQNESIIAEKYNDASTASKNCPQWIEYNKENVQFTSCTIRDDCVSFFDNLQFAHWNEDAKVWGHCGSIANTEAYQKAIEKTEGCEEWTRGSPQLQYWDC